MREAVGGSILFYIILGFLAVYIVFIGVIINYAATYRASNYVLTKLETTLGNYEIGTSSDTVDAGTLYGDLKNQHYYNELNVCCDDSNSKGAILKIRTYVNFEVPLLGFVGEDVLKLTIKNETKTLYGVRCSDTKYNNSLC